MSVLKYKKGYKYQLAEDFVFELPKKILGKIEKPLIDQSFIDLEPNGILIIRAGYAWDGPSGPTFDTKTFMKGALVHDALYQLIRNGYFFDDEKARELADDLLKEMCRRDRMIKVRAWWVHFFVRKFGTHAATTVKKVFIIE
jgi:hypothetical protein